MNKQRRTSYWFLVGSKFDSGQDVLWNIEDEPFSITPPYIIGDKEFLEEVNDMFGNKFAKKLIKAIDKNNYREVFKQEKINILHAVYGVGTFIALHRFNETVEPNNLIVYEVII